MLEHEKRLVEALRSHAPTLALVGERIAINAAQQGTPTPRITITTSLTPDVGLAGNILAWGMQANIQCWDASALGASLLADQAHAALVLALYQVPSRVAGYDDDLGLDAVVLTLEDWLDQDDITEHTSIYIDPDYIDPDYIE
jgi:hypothetical protein